MALLRAGWGSPSACGCGDALIPTRSAFASSGGPTFPFQGEAEPAASHMQWRYPTGETELSRVRGAFMYQRFPRWLARRETPGLLLGPNNEESDGSSGG